jgi:hypothetical protein
MEFNPLLIKMGIVKGHGFDAVGEFDINGYHTSKKVVFIKQYIGQHSILYEGNLHHDGKHVKGRWTLEEFSGEFELKLQ